jgi:phage shock protein PspC (stress-responsive transcriptional regulator)
MKQIENVSISGISFMLDAQGYETLKSYLARLEEMYRVNPDGKEIIADIEARIAELILAKQAPGGMVSGALIEQITERMGLPEDDSADPDAKGEASTPERTFPRRLFRDTATRRIGGVCGGIASFIGMDPVWVRLAAFAPLILLILTAPFGWEFLSSMFGVMLASVVAVYFLLWFTVPAARTPRQRLEMRGKRITASTIEHNFRHAAARDARSQRTASVWAEVVWSLGRIVLFFIKAVAMIATFALVLAGMCILFLLGAVLLTPDATFIGDLPLADVFPAFQIVSARIYAALTLLAALMPVAMLAVLLMGLVFDRRVRGFALTIIGAVWLLVLAFWGVVTVRNSQNILDGFHGLEHRIEVRYDIDTDSHRDHHDHDTAMPVDTLPPVTVEVVE